MVLVVEFFFDTFDLTFHNSRVHSLKKHQNYGLTTSGLILKFHQRQKFKNCSKSTDRQADQFLMKVVLI